ncbi:DUF6232 family protein [Actinoplanes sp. NPDC049599]|uniref:DUF6232 family protein n=1 Tax=Actinoplanes sp. NPDC049599 TaxID=3363903 RepID=UPI0037ABCAED
MTSASRRIITEASMTPIVARTATGHCHPSSASSSGGRRGSGGRSTSPAADQVREPARSQRNVAVVVALVELALAAPLALIVGSGVLLVAAILAASSLAIAILVDARRNPRWMSLTTIIRGRELTIFSTRDRREFERVRRALVRAIESARGGRYVL